MSHAFKFGALTGVVASVYMLVLQFSGMITNRWLGWVAVLFVAAGIALAQLSYRKSQGGVMGYGKALVVGLVTMTLAEVIANAYLFIHVKFVSSEYLDNILDAQVAAMEQQQMPAEQIDAFLNGPMTNPAVIAVMAFIFSMILGTVLVLIISAITKKSPGEV